MASWEYGAILQFSELSRSDFRQARRVAAAIERYERESYGDIKKLQGRDNEWRLRVGDWRVIFRRQGEVFTILHLSNRRDAYE